MGRLAFDGQREDETLVLIFRRHSSTLRGGWKFLIISIIIGIIVLKISPDSNLTFWLFLAIIGIGFVGWLYSYILWYFSYFILTNQRFRQITQKSLFKKSVLDLPLKKVESVAYLTPNLFAGLFKYGTLVIKTSTGDMRISKIANIESVYEKLQSTIGVDL